MQRPADVVDVLHGQRLVGEAFHRLPCIAGSTPRSPIITSMGSPGIR